ncbi:MAG TPA: hypothetical protein VNK04_17305 [Gemmataceae bacterium]|jgi:uncharacterized membrane protein|nr:hypothetical protein [Gemmataceae bacterium]
MKKLLALAVVALIGAVGCDGKSTPGGPGATNPRSGPGLTTPENTFKLDVPNTETTLKQGEAKMITIGLERGKNFDQDVNLDFSGAPKGVTVTPDKGMIKAGEKEITVKIEADKEAALGHHTITVTGTPAKGGSKASAEIKIEVQSAK